jgi:cytochrome c-type biogenesis protein CcmE
VKRYDRAVLVLLLLVFAAGIVFSARNAMTPYVTFAEARKTDRTVQVKGLALSDSLTALADGYSFQMEDDNGEVVRVLVAGSVPDNLFAGESIVVTGKFSGPDFAAAQVLVKCPSKYEAEKHPDEIRK